MSSHDECIQALLRAEGEFVAERIAQDPRYEEHLWDIEDAWLTVRRNAPAGFDWAPLELPVTFCAAPLQHITDAARSMAARFKTRSVLRHDRHEVNGLAVTAYVLSDTDGNDWPALRLSVADAGHGARVVRADLPCTACYATAGRADVTCEAGECHLGWIYRGGIVVDLIDAIDTTRLNEPSDARWHAWYSG